MNKPDKEKITVEGLIDEFNMEESENGLAPAEGKKPGKGRVVLFRKPGKKDIKQLALMAVITIAIIVIGVSIPVLVVSRYTSARALPEGQAEIEAFQPYGADQLDKELPFLRAIQQWESEIYCGLYGCNSSVEFSVFSSNDYSEIGIVSDNPYVDTEDECFFVLSQTVCDTLGGELIPQFSGNEMGADALFLYGDPGLGSEYSDSNAIIERSTGAPLRYSIQFAAPTDAVSGDMEGTMESLSESVISIYEDYTGLDFQGTDDTFFYDADNEWDYSYYCSVRTPDERLILNINIGTGYYWTEPEYAGDTYHPTEDYLWTIEFIFIEG